MVSMFESGDKVVSVRVNGGLEKNKTVLEQEVTGSLKDLLKEVCRKYGCKDNYRQARLYTKKGVEIQKQDVEFLNDRDVVYVALKGEAYNNCAILDDYETGEVLGTGGFGKVMLATDKARKRKVAIKYIDVSDQLASADQVADIYKEAQNLKMLRHKNIVELHHTLLEGKSLVMIMEVATGGEVYAFVRARGSLSEVVSRNIIYQVVDAISYCHERRVVHRDLKLENVLFSSPPDEDNLHIKVIDFGIAGVVRNDQGDKIDAGSLAYMPPECFQSGPSETTFAIDVWAIGIMFYAMLFGDLPFYNRDEDKLITAICSQPLKFDPKVPVTDEAKHIMTRMLEKDPTKRMRLVEVMDSEYYQMTEQQVVELVANAGVQHEEKQAAREEQKREKQKLNDKFKLLNVGGKAGTGSEVSPPRPGNVGKPKKAASYSQQQMQPPASKKGRTTSAQKKTREPRK